MIWKTNNTMYQGSWEDNLPNGNGIQVIGNLKNNIANININDKTQLIGINYFEGCFKNGKKQGFGCMIYATGARYDGMWENNFKVKKKKILFFFEEKQLISQNKNKNKNIKNHIAWKWTLYS